VLHRAIVRTIVALAHNLGLKVVADGVETVQEVDEFVVLDCEYAQGYFFSRPVDEAAVVRLLISDLCGKKKSSRGATVG
jgi:EAL domain-containing protein (putative c-di-GMP-specific phosphodiesterase class I)